jgi:hypothetical protein
MFCLLEEAVDGRMDHGIVCDHQAMAWQLSRVRTLQSMKVDPSRYNATTRAVNY